MPIAVLGELELVVHWCCTTSSFFPFSFVLSFSDLLFGDIKIGSFRRPLQEFYIWSIELSNFSALPQQYLFLFSE